MRALAPLRKQLLYVVKSKTFLKLEKLLFEGNVSIQEMLSSTLILFTQKKGLEYIFNINFLNSFIIKMCFDSKKPLDYITFDLYYVFLQEIIQSVHFLEKINLNFLLKI